jgi:hypothetical protein
MARKAKPPLGRIRDRSNLRVVMPSETGKSLIAVIAGTAGGGGFQDTPYFSDSSSYSTSIPEEMGALINGNTGKMKSWVSGMDKRPVTRLFLCRKQDAC